MRRNTGRARAAELRFYRHAVEETHAAIDDAAAAADDGGDASSLHVVVEVQRARGLAAVDKKGHAHPFCAITLVEATTGKALPKPHHKASRTRVVKGTTAPSWETTPERFAFDGVPVATPSATSGGSPRRRGARWFVDEPVVADPLHTHPPNCLRVAVVRGRGLRAMDGKGVASSLLGTGRGGSSDPFVTVGTKRFVAKTKVKAKTLDPVWMEAFELEYDAGDAWLRLRVDDSDVAGHEFMGSGLVKLSELPPSHDDDGSATAFWVTLIDGDCGHDELEYDSFRLRARDRETNLGEIKVAVKLCYDRRRDPSEDRPFFDEAPDPAAAGRWPNELRVAVCRAEGLREGDAAVFRSGSGSSDPYVRLSLEGDFCELLQRTKTAMKTTHPVFNEIFAFELDGDAVCRRARGAPFALKLEVFDWDWIGDDDFLGQCRLPCRTSSTTRCTTRRAAGGLYYTPFLREPPCDEEPNVLCVALVQARDLAVKDRGLLKSAAHAANKLHLAHFAESSADGSADPRAVFKVRSRVDGAVAVAWRSSTAPKTLHPVWHEQWKLRLDRSDIAAPVLSLELEDVDAYTKNDFMGRVDVDLSPLLDREVHRGWHKLLSTRAGDSDNVRGAVELVLKWCRDDRAPRRRRRRASPSPRPRGPEPGVGLFGAGAAPAPVDRGGGREEEATGRAPAVAEGRLSLRRVHLCDVCVCGATASRAGSGSCVASATVRRVSAANPESIVSLRVSLDGEAAAWAFRRDVLRRRSALPPGSCPPRTATSAAEFCAACGSGDLDRARALLDAVAVDARDANGAGETALTRAVRLAVVAGGRRDAPRYGRALDILDLLMDRGADPYARSYEGQSAVDVLTTMADLHTGVPAEAFDAVRAIIGRAALGYHEGGIQFLTARDADKVRAYQKHERALVEAKRIEERLRDAGMAHALKLWTKQSFGTAAIYAAENDTEDTGQVELTTRAKQRLADALRMHGDPRSDPRNFMHGARRAPRRRRATTRRISSSGSSAAT
ncbi:C2 domain-containing protein [Aureococcus anophagefferens]|nr:C2 domain-containing protein [Aureococcus anophagefferens]